MDKDAKRIGHRMLKLYEDQAPEIQAKAAEGKASCRSGCGHCCHLLIIISLPEAIAIAENLLQLPPRMLGVATRALYEQSQKLQFDKDAHFKAQVPCAFLTSQNTCSIYSVRPSPCRTHLAVTPAENCANGAADPTVGRIDLQHLDQEAVEMSLKLSRQRGYPPLLAPIPVAVLWAIRLLTQGEAGFLSSLQTAPSQGLADIRAWTGSIMAAATSAEEKADGQQATDGQQADVTPEGP